MFFFKIKNMSGHLSESGFIKNYLYFRYEFFEERLTKN